MRAALAMLLVVSPAVAAATGAGAVANAGPGEGAGAGRRAEGLDGFAMPSRRPDAPQLTLRVEAVANELAREIGGCCRRAPAAEDLSATLAAAAELQAAGRLDEAADSFDLALRRGADAPHRVSDPAAFVGAHVARASIALARGEVALGESLLARALRYDATFALSSGEDSPTVRAALERVKGRPGATGAVPGDLGGACGEVSHVMVVARFVAGGAEFRRLDGCRVVGSVVATAPQSAAEIARILAGHPARAAAGSRGVTGRGAVGAADLTAGRGEEERPLYRRAWFWVAIGGVAAASAGAVFLIARDPSDELEVTQRF